MADVSKWIQGLIFFSVILGVAFLVQAHGLIPDYVFYILTFGWGLFVVDAALTFVRPRTSYIIGMVLALVALTETVSQPEHYALVQGGNVPATVTLLLGSVSQAFLIALVVYYLFRKRKKDPWAWPNGEAQAEDAESTNLGS